MRQIAVGEKCVDASFVPLCDQAFQVGRGLVPHQPCFGVLTASTRESTRSPQLCPPPAGKAERNESWNAQLCSAPKRIRRGQAPNGRAREVAARVRVTMILSGCIANAVDITFERSHKAVEFLFESSQITEDFHKCRNASYGRFLIFERRALLVVIEEFIKPSLH